MRRVDPPDRFMLAEQDANYWGLTTTERISHHYRLSVYHGRRAVHLAERSYRAARRMSIMLGISTGLAVASLMIRIFWG